MIRKTVSYLQTSRFLANFAVLNKNGIYVNRLDSKRVFWGGGVSVWAEWVRKKLQAHRQECVRPKFLSRFDLNAQTDRCMTSKHRGLCRRRGSSSLWVKLTQSSQFVIQFDCFCSSSLTKFQSKPQQNCFVSLSNTAVFWMNPRFWMNQVSQWFSNPFIKTVVTCLVFEWISRLNEWLMTHSLKQSFTAIYWWFGFIFKSNAFFPTFLCSKIFKTLIFYAFEILWCKCIYGTSASLNSLCNATSDAAFVS